MKSIFGVDLEAAGVKFGYLTEEEKAALGIAPEPKTELPFSARILVVKRNKVVVGTDNGKTFHDEVIDLSVVPR